MSDREKPRAPVDLLNFQVRFECGARSRPGSQEVAYIANKQTCVMYFIVFLLSHKARTRDIRSKHVIHRGRTGGEGRGEGGLVTQRQRVQASQNNDRVVDIA